MSCRNRVTTCSVDCVGASCQSFTNMNGACLVSAVDEASCNSYGMDPVWFMNAICILTAIGDEDACFEVKGGNGIFALFIFLLLCSHCSFFC